MLADRQQASLQGYAKVTAADVMLHGICSKALHLNSQSSPLLDDVNIHLASAGPCCFLHSFPRAYGLALWRRCMVPVDGLYLHSIFVYRHCVEMGGTGPMEAGGSIEGKGAALAALIAGQAPPGAPVPVARYSPADYES